MFSIETAHIYTLCDYYVTRYSSVVNYLQTSYQTSSPHVKMAEAAGKNSENPEKLSTVTSKKFCKGKIDKSVNP